jgi:hypothetical protein
MDSLREPEDIPDDGQASNEWKTGIRTEGTHLVAGVSDELPIARPRLGQAPAQ